jgi:hypothetical protein
MDNYKMDVWENEDYSFPYILITKDELETDIKIVNYQELYYTTVTICLNDGSVITS